MDERDKVKTNEPELVGLCKEVAAGRISRRQFFERAAILGLSASAIGTVLAACGTKKDDGGTGNSPAPMDTTMPGEVYLYNWSDYMAGSVKKSFEKKTGIRVVETYFDDNEALLAKLKAGATGYDVIVPSDYMIHIMIKTELLEPLDMNYIPNYKYVDARFLKPAYDDPDENGGKFSVPYQWGTTGYAVRTDKIDPAAVGKWTDLWNPEYKGLIQMLNDERETPGAALKMLGFSINTTDQAQLDQATEKLIEQKPLVRTYDSVNMKRAMVSGTPLTMCWNGDPLLAIDSLGGDAKAKSLLSFLLPTEGFAWWVDTLAVPKGAKSRYAAHLFLDYCLDPKIQGELSSWIWYLPVEMQAARPYTDPFVFINEPAEEDIKQRGELFNDVGTFARNYAEAWAKVKSA